MIEFDEGCVLSGRVTLGLMVGFITRVDRFTYTVRWIDGEYSTQLRPDDPEDEQ